MYLISLYFDENTQDKLKYLMKKVAEKSGNPYMIEANVPPHITIAMFDTKEENKVIELFDTKIHEIGKGMLQWVSK